MSTKSARLGFPPVKKETVEAVEAKREAELFLENPVWQTVKNDLRQAYIDQFLACPETDDLMRFRLQVALQVIDKVENHVVIAHSHAEVEVEKAVKADLKTSANPFRRR